MKSFYTSLQPGIVRIEHHPSWLAVDVIQGCPASCEYCFLNTQSLTASIPRYTADPSNVVEELDKHFRRIQDKTGINAEEIIPICFGNNTDLLLTKLGQESLLEQIGSVRHRFSKAILIVVTKGKLNKDMAKRLVDCAGTMVIVFSISFLGQRYEQGAPHWHERLKGMQIAAGTEGLIPVHYWRPATSVSTPNIETAAKQIQMLKDAGSIASSLIGLAIGPGLGSYYRDSVERTSELRSIMSYYRLLGLKSSVVTTGNPEVKDWIINEAYGAKYPIFVNTSCMISYASKQPDYSAAYSLPRRYKRCHPSACPPIQRYICYRCWESSKTPSDKVQNVISRYLGISPKKIVGNAPVVLETPIKQEDLYCLQMLVLRSIEPTKIVRNMAWLIKHNGK
jgi:hypothetical protein